MAKKQNEDALATTQPAGLPAVPEHLQAFVGQQDGAESIGRDDVLLPRVALAQALSPQLKEEDSKYVADLKLGQMFNTLTGGVYGRGPLRVTIVKVIPPRWVEFNPIDQGGGVKDLDVKPGDPRTEWRTVDGQREKPVATQFYDYVVLLWTSDAMPELVGLSFKSTGIKIAKQLNGLVKLRNMPVWTGVYELRSVTENGPAGPYYNFAVRNAGHVDAAQAPLAQKAFENLKDRVVTVETETVHDDGDATTGEEPAF